MAEHYNYAVTILSLNNNDSNPFYQFSNKINFVRIKAQGNALNYIKAYIKGLQEQVDAIQPDIVCVCDDGLKAFFIPQFLRTKATIIYERHVSKEIEMNESSNSLKKITVRLKWLLMRLLAPRFSKFIVLTKGNVQEWKSLKNLKIIPNPLSFFPNQSSRLQNKKVIAVGKQGYQKGYDLLLHSWKLVYEKHPDWALEIYGTIAAEYKLQELAYELGIGNIVHFYPPVKDIQTKYLDASIYAMSSRFEGFGMVLIEAMACGLPCVSFDCPHGPADIITHGEDGILVSKGDLNELTKGLIDLIEKKALRQEMGAKAKENVKRYLPEHIMPIWDHLFQQLVHARSL